jgi:hypothetical protein
MRPCGQTTYKFVFRLKVPIRHCEERKRRGNPEGHLAPPVWIAAPTARNDGELFRRHHHNPLRPFP